MRSPSFVSESAENAPADSTSSSGYYPKPLPTLDAVCIEVVVVHGEDSAEGLASRELYQRSVGEIHGSIVILLHERNERSHVRVVYRQYCYGPGPDESPRRPSFPLAVTHQVKQLGEHSGRRD